MIQTKIFPLGRNPSPLDPQDYQLAAFMPKLAANLFVAPDTNWEYLVAPLNQENSVHCTGFSIANWGINLPTQTNFTNQDGHDFYYKCKLVDREPLKENGSSIRSVAKVLKQEGMIEAYAFASSVPEMKWWLVNKGPMIVGTIWTYSMFVPDSENIIHITGGESGGHAYVINEIKGDSLFGIQNSWNGNWGINGKAYIPISEFTTLFRAGGEAVCAVELDSPIVQIPQETGCLSTLLNIFKSK